MTAQFARHPNPTARAQRLAYLIWERPDLQRAATFFDNFGLQLAERAPDALYFRGTAAAPFCCIIRHGAQARFSGFALELCSRQDLKRLQLAHPGSRIEPLDTPGGGLVLRLTDPAGFLVEAVYGQQAYPLLRINATQRLLAQAPDVARLDHVVLEVADFQATCTWYTQHFGLIPSDVQVLPDGSPAMVLMRLDLGDTPADHHTIAIAIAQGFMATYSHSVYKLMSLTSTHGMRLLTHGAMAGTTHSSLLQTFVDAIHAIPHCRPLLPIETPP